VARVAQTDGRVHVIEGPQGEEQIEGSTSADRDGRQPNIDELDLERPVSNTTRPASSVDRGLKTSNKEVLCHRRCRRRRTSPMRRTITPAS
jgi:hypothetical protein